jgi:hypothetical protein
MLWISRLGHGPGGTGRRSGQVLLIAVLLMLAILLLGALFVAIVTYNQYQSARHGDVLLARSLAEAGIRFADYMLQHSPLGADWRPPLPPGFDVATGQFDAAVYGPDGAPDTDDDYYSPEELARGYHTLYDSAAGTILRIGFTRYPDRLGGSAGPPLDEATMGQGYFLLRVTYDPDPPFEPADNSLQPDPFSKYIKIEAVGVVRGRANVQRHLVAYKPLGLTDYLFWVTDHRNTGRTAQLGAEPWIDFDASGDLDIRSDPDVHRRGEFLVCDYRGPIRVNTELQLVGGNLDGDPTAGRPLDPAQASNQFVLTTAPVPGGAPPTPRGGYVRDDRLEVEDGIRDPAQGAPGSAVPGQTAAISERTPAGTNLLGTIWPSDSANFRTYGGLVLDGSRAEDADGQARFVKPVVAPDLLAPDPVTGVDRYRALTRDSGAPVVVGGTDTYTGALGHGPGMYIDNTADLQFVRSDGSHDLDSLVQDWLRQIPAGDPRASQSGWNALYTLYVPPGVEIELCDSEAAASQGRTIVTSDVAPPRSPGEVWWPRHQPGEPGIRLVRHDKHWACADGSDSGLNEMVIDYPADPAHAVIFAEGNIRIRGVLPRARRAANGTLVRQYNLTVVSNGTIYIDGQLLSPQDVDPSLPDEDDSKIALLARDHVCLNTTMLVPQMTSGLVPAAPDDPANPSPEALHWALAEGAGYLWSAWMFGGAPAERVWLHVRHTGADPGPAGAGMHVRSGGAAVPYDFDGNPAAPYAYTYAFVPPGAVLPPGLAGSNTIAPLWETAGWDLTPYLDLAVGAPNALTLFHKDPQLAPGCTDYWVKRWKLQEWQTIGGARRPVATLHARVNALIYAQDGCWFVIPGNYFDPEASARDADGDGVADAIEYRRYNYEITIRGAITENYTAPAEAAREWMDKWAYPVWLDANTVCWATLHYEFDESLRAGRDQPPGLVPAGSNVRICFSNPRSSAWNLPRLPLLPVSPSLIYYGQAW